jgi:hypothetical protein
MPNSSAKKTRGYQGCWIKSGYCECCALRIGGSINYIPLFRYIKTLIVQKGDALDNEASCHGAKIEKFSAAIFIRPKVKLLGLNI